MLGELNRAMSGVRLFAVAAEADAGDCVLVDEAAAAAADAVVVVAVLVVEGDELSVLKKDANLL